MVNSGEWIHQPVNESLSLNRIIRAVNFTRTKPNGEGRKYQETMSETVYYLRHKNRGSVFLAYLRFLSLKFKKLYEFRGKNQII